MAMRNIKIVIVEDDIYYNTVLSKYMKCLSKSIDFRDIEFEIQSFFNAKDCLENIERDTDIVLLDYYLENSDLPNAMNGMQLMEEIKKRCKNCKVIIISGQQNIVTTVELLKKGAYDYIEKGDFSTNRAFSIVQNIIAHEKN